MTGTLLPERVPGRRPRLTMPVWVRRRGGRADGFWWGSPLRLSFSRSQGVLIANAATSSGGHSGTTVGTSNSVTSHTTTITQTGNVVSQGTASLSDPTQGFDLLTGGPVFFVQSQMAWDGSRLAIFDETTLGAANLGRVRFDQVGLATLRPLHYGTGAANPPLGPSAIPAGDVLAIHVADTTYAKVEILGIDSNGALQFRWVTYTTTSS